jgi:hypothetical protein
MFEALDHAGFDIATSNHARAILTADFPDAAAELVSALTSFRLSARDLIRSGGGQAESTMRLRDSLYAMGWPKHEFIVQTVVDGVEREATSHEIDHVKRWPEGTLALEIEWNNKDPFFDRDLENFQRLHAQGAISAGVLITRGASLQAALVEIIAGALQQKGILDVAELDAWGVKERTRRQTANLQSLMDAQIPFAAAFARSFVADKFGASTTHWTKLAERIRRGVGNPCPLLLIGLPVSVVDDYSAASDEL